MNNIIYISFSWLFLFSVSCNSQTQGNKKQILSTTEFNIKLQETTNPQILDVRTDEEFEGGYIAGALNIDVLESDFINKVSVLDKTKPVFVYCHSGGRSSDAANELVLQGFTQVYDLKGGISAWKSQKMPIETK